MRIIVTEDYEGLSIETARIIAGQLALIPRSVLGLATGGTPLGTYQKLIDYHHQHHLDFSQATSFNLDEYVGVATDNPHSYHAYMFKNLFDAINIHRKNIHIPNGMAGDLERECAAYETAIENAGGIDLQLLGIGNNGHIGFNEPDLSFEAITHVVKLDDQTIRANARFFSRPEEVPQYAVSMGIKTIMRARTILLLANGSGKADVIHQALFGEISPRIPASILQLHPNVIVVLEQDAATKLPKTYPNKFLLF